MKIIVLASLFFPTLAFSEEARFPLDEKWEVQTYCHEVNAPVADQYILFKQKDSDRHVIIDKVEQKQYLAQKSQDSFSWTTSAAEKSVSFDADNSLSATLSLKVSDKISTRSVTCQWD